MEKDKKYYVANITEHHIKDGNMEVWGTECGDDYHTISELYDHRMALNIALFHAWFVANRPSIKVMKSKLHNDGTMFPGYFIVMALTTEGQISYHYELSHWDKFKIPEVERTPEWDGHGSQNVLERLEKL